MTNQLITDSEIQQDILDTKREIENMEAEQRHFEATPPTSHDYRWNMMRASARRDGIVERLQFIAKLENILTERADSQRTEGAGQNGKL